MAEKQLLSGKRVLVVEDEFLLALDLAEELEDLGASSVILSANLAAAMNAADDPLHVAFLDVDLPDRTSFPAAAKLRGRGVPVVFVTGQRSRDIPERLRQPLPGTRLLFTFTSNPALRRPPTSAESATILFDLAGVTGR